ncbi:ESX-1 secretion-associated protein EspI-like [Ochlerotatus camptorhynchus]|uniref:ESX-1 secretion-associated protein EspI-like n=1 Tax=Ochlerotatus camptorhynchus TaxID=644619 RepID=UPI0031E1CB2A
MLKLFVCIVVAFISQAECKPYSKPNPYPGPQRQCRTAHCNVNPALRNEGLYPSTNQLQRVGVYPGCNADNSHEYEENHPPPPPAPPAEKCDKSLPVSVCVQIPPETALKLPKCVLQQIVYALTRNDDAPEHTPVEPPCTQSPCTQSPCTQSPPPCTQTTPLPTPTPTTTTAAPVAYPSLNYPFRPSGYCGSCRSSLTPRYNQS